MRNTINRGLELNELVMNYRNTGDERYFEELWSRVKPFAFKMGTKYKNTIALEEMEQIAMICLFDCCRYIKEGTNVLTYYGRILINRYYDEYNAPKKRGNVKLNKEALSLDSTYEDNENSALRNNPGVEDDIFIVEDFYKQCKLLDNEIIFVELLAMGYRQKDIIKKLNIEQKDYKRVMKNLRKKIRNNYDFGTI